MPPHMKDGVGGPRSKGKPAPAHRRREARSRIFRELVHIAAEQGASIQMGVSTASALQECLDRSVSLMRFAADMVDQLTVDTDPNTPASEDGFFEVIPNPQGPDLVQPNRWYLMEREARIEVEKLAAMMTQLQVADRVVRVQEAQAALVIAAVREAAVEAGLDHDQVRALGAALRNQMEHKNSAHAPLQGKVPNRRTARTADQVRRELAPIENEAPSVISPD